MARPRQVPETSLAFVRLRVDELAQIAGRAGRYTRDGSFGTLNSVGGLDPEAALAIEQHRFPPLRSLYWRNAELDFGSLSALLESLDAPSPKRCLRRHTERERRRASGCNAQKRTNACCPETKTTPS